MSNWPGCRWNAATTHLPAFSHSHAAAPVHSVERSLNALQVKAEEFFLGYRKVALEAHEVLLRVSIPFNAQHEYVREFKQAHRRDDDIAIVNAGMRVQMARTMSGG